MISVTTARNPNQSPVRIDFLDARAVARSSPGKNKKKKDGKKNVGLSMVIEPRLCFRDDSVKHYARATTN